QKLFASQEPREKRRLLNFLLSNCTWEDGDVVATFRQPFDRLAETTLTAAPAAAGETAKTAKTGIWLGRQDSNLRSRDQNPLPYRLATPHRSRRRKNLARSPRPYIVPMAD